MRRSKKKLHVDTFPFLAVLLCAMGALIFLLLVMDRRAKAVARAKITKEIEARRLERSEKFTEKLAEKTAEEKAKQEAEWTSQRAKLHAILQEQEQELRAQLVTMTRDAQSTTKTLEKKQDGIGALEQMLDSQRQRLATEQKQLADVQTGFTVQEKQEAAATSEMRRLSAELLQLEKALRDLRALKSRKSDSFSLVPYRGRLGDSRQPIYVECTVAGLVVHPGPTVLDLDRRLAVTTGSVEGLDQVITDYEHRLRQAIQEHAGQLDLQKERDPRAPHIAPPTNTRSYVLFLVRPDGILSYQIAQDALHGYAIDYGYELVDPQWVFDFSSEEIAAQQQWNKDGPALPRPQIGGDRSSWTPGRPPGRFVVAGPGSGVSGAPGYGFSGPAGTGLSGPPVSNIAGPPGSGLSGPSGPGTAGRTVRAGSVSDGPGTHGNAAGLSAPNAGPSGTAAYASGSDGSGGQPGLAGDGTGNGRGPGFSVIPGFGSAGVQGFGGSPGSGIPGSGPPGSGSPGNPGNSVAGVPGGMGFGPGGSMFGTGGGSTGPAAPDTGIPRLGFQPGTLVALSPGAAGTPFPRLPTFQGGSGQGNVPGGIPGSGAVGSGFNGPPPPGYVPGAGQQGTGGGVAGTGLPGNPGPFGSGPKTNAGNSGGSVGSGTGGTGAQPSGPDGGQTNGGAAPGLSFGNNNGAGDVRNGLNTGPNKSGMGAAPGDNAPGSAGPAFGGTSSWASSSSPTNIKAPPPLSTLIGNHDQVITIDCVADGAVLNPSYMLYPINPPANRRRVEQALVETIQKTMERRQATVRLGEPSYRFMIRLRVQADGLPTYFWIYPPLQALHVPLSRENAEE